MYGSVLLPVYLDCWIVPGEKVGYCIGVSSPSKDVKDILFVVS